MRKLLTNPKIKALFLHILFCTLLFETGMIVLLSLRSAPAAYLLCLPVLMGAVTAFFCYRFFREQEQIIEDAAEKVREYISGNREARIECSEEGEWYRLFHEVNALAAILNAKAENEGRARAALKNTISDISHQLKTPLAALNIYNGIIQTEAEAKELSEVQEFSALSEQELDRIETLVQNLLKIAKFDAGTIAIERKSENLAEMMADVRKRFLFRATQEGKEIALAGSESLSFFCDRYWIVEAVGNIVKNALDHTDSGDVVRITWGQSASVVHITVQDNGKGICPEDLHHIFKRFYRSRYSKDTQGIGLGLPLAKSVVEAHNGTIEVDSWLGEGTAFDLSFLIPTKM